MEGPFFCGYCSTRLTEVVRFPSALALRRRTTLEERLRGLAQHKTSTARQHESVRVAFLAYLREECGQEAHLGWARPSDVIGYLVSKDETGTIVMHEKWCAQWGVRTTKKARTCACPVRAAASAINTQQGWLQAVFRDAGFTKPYCVSTATGNPANEHTVHAHVDMCLRERATAGLKPQQSDVVSSQIVIWMLKYVDIRRGAAVSRKAWGEAASWSRMRLFVAACWATGLRASDVLRILYQQITPTRDEATGKAALSLLVTVTKVSHDAGGIRSVLLDGGLGPLSCGAALAAYDTDLRKLGLHLGQGPLFRRFVVSGRHPQWRKSAMSRDAMATQFDKVVTACRINGKVTLHSLHGSSSVHDMENGVPAADTMRRIGWTYDTYAYYTLGRRVLRLEDVRLCTPAASASPTHVESDSASPTLVSLESE